MESSQKEKIYRQILEFKPKKSDLRRMAILDAVIDCIAQKGIDETSSETVGKMAKMRRSHVAYYFPNRQKMLEAAAQFVVATGQEIMVSYLVTAKTKEEQLSAFVDSMFIWLERHPKHAAVLSLLYHYSYGIPAFKKMNQAIKEGSENRIASILLLGKPKPNKKQEKEALILATDLRTYLVGNLLDYFCCDNREDCEERKNHVNQYILKLASAFWK